MEEATRGSLGTYWHGGLNSRRDPEQLDTAYHGHPVFVYGGGGSGGVQIEVGQATYPCCHPYKSKPHDKSQCLIACARVLI